MDPARDGLNWYVYCYNNPLKFVDPNGLQVGAVILLSNPITAPIVAIAAVSYVTYDALTDGPLTQAFTGAVDWIGGKIGILWAGNKDNSINISSDSQNILSGMEMSTPGDPNDPNNWNEKNKASLSERIRTKITGKTSIDRLKPNPADDFMSSRIGPSDKWLSFHRNYMIKNNAMTEPIRVTRVDAYYFRIVDGHHRWTAAQQLGWKRVPIEVIK